MYLSLLFWLGLALPGYVIVRRYWKEDLESGLLGALGVSYLASLGLLSPVSIFCYLSRTPLYVLSGAYLLAVLVAIFEIARKGWWKEWGALLKGGISAGLFIVLADMVLGGLVGGQTGGDGAFHLTRIRQLLEHGFTNTDPFVSFPYFFATYHTNIYHALHAVCSQITGVDHVSVWFLSTVWVKLLIASGAYYMAWAVFDRHWPAWVAAVFTVGCQGPITFTLYPNKLAPYWVVPLMIGFAARAFGSRSGWTWAVKLGIGSLILGQLHSLYGVFAAIALAPILSLGVIVPLLRKRIWNRPLTACVLALLPALPFAWIAKEYSNAGMSSIEARQVDQSTSGDADSPEEAAGFHYFDNGWIMMNARYGWGVPGSLRSALLSLGLIVGIATALLSRRRREALVVLAFAVTIVGILRVPPLCTLAIHLFLREWIVARFAMFLYLTYIVLVPAALAYFVEPQTRFWWVRWVLTIAIGLTAIPFVNQRTEDYTWLHYLKSASSSSAERHKHLTTTKTIVAFCREFIPKGTTVLLEPFQGMVLTSIHDCHVVAPQNSGNGIKDIGQRRIDLRAMLSLNTPWSVRRNLLRKYHIKYFFPAGAPVGWVRGHLADLHQFGRRSALYVLNLDS